MDPDGAALLRRFAFGVERMTTLMVAGRVNTPAEA